MLNQGATLLEEAAFLLQLLLFSQLSAMLSLLYALYVVCLYLAYMLLLLIPIAAVAVIEFQGHRLSICWEK